MCVHFFFLFVFHLSFSVDYHILGITTKNGLIEIAEKWFRNNGDGDDNDTDADTYTDNDNDADGGSNHNDDDDDGNNDMLIKIMMAVTMMIVLEI